MEEKTKVQLDRRLGELRQAIKSKRDNIIDLEKILYDDIKRMKSFPIYYWLLLIVHFFLMFVFWSGAKAIPFILNVIMFDWLNRKRYREVAMNWCMVMSLVVMILSWAF